MIQTPASRTLRNRSRRPVNPRHRMVRYLPASPNDGLLRTAGMLRHWEEHLRRTLDRLSVALAYSSLLFIRCLPDMKRTETLWLWTRGGSERRDLLDLKIGINGFNPSVAQADCHTGHVTMFISPLFQVGLPRSGMVGTSVTSTGRPANNERNLGFAIAWKQ